MADRSDVEEYIRNHFSNNNSFKCTNGDEPVEVDGLGASGEDSFRGVRPLIEPRCPYYNSGRIASTGSGDCSNHKSNGYWSCRHSYTKSDFIKSTYEGYDFYNI